MAARAGKSKGPTALADLFATLAFSIMTGALSALAFVIAALALAWLSAVAHGVKGDGARAAARGAVQYAAFQSQRRRPPGEERPAGLTQLTVAGRGDLDSATSSQPAVRRGVSSRGRGRR